MFTCHVININSSVKFEERNGLKYFLKKFSPVPIISVVVSQSHFN